MERQPESEQIQRLTVKTVDQVFIGRADSSNVILTLTHSANLSAMLDHTPFRTLVDH